MLRTQPSFGVVLLRVSDDVLREPIIELALETIETLRHQSLNGMVVIATIKRIRLRRIR